MDKEIFARLINFTGAMGGDLIFLPMVSKAQGLMTKQRMEYTAKEMETLLHLAEENGIRIRFTPFVTDGGEIRYQSEELRIGIRAGMGFDEYVYNLAHELAHYFLHYDKGDTITGERHEEYEEQADRGAKMLMAALSVGTQGSKIATSQ